MPKGEKGTFGRGLQKFISNNLPYANRVAYDPVYAKGAPGGAAWFTTIATQQKNDLKKRILKELGKIK